MSYYISGVVVMDGNRKITSAQLGFQPTAEIREMRADVFSGIDGKKLSAITTGSECWCPHPSDKLIFEDIEASRAVFRLWWQTVGMFSFTARQKKFMLF